MWDWSKESNSELRSKVFMLTSRTESSRLLKSHNKKSITIKVNRTDISPLDQYTSLRCITYAGPVTCCFIITYHPVANQCYRQPAIIIMQISHTREWRPQNLTGEKPVEPENIHRKRHMTLAAPKKEPKYGIWYNTRRFATTDINCHQGSNVHS